MKALVTGATGFVGGHLVDQLLARDDEVTALVRSPRKADRLAERGVRLIVGDLADSGALAASVAGQDVVFHVAGLTGGPTEAGLMAANRDGTARLAEAARAGAPGTRVVLVSSLAAAGPSRRGTPHASADERAPVTAYGRSKLASEDALRSSGVPFVIVRPPIVYGPRDRDGLHDVFRAARLGIGPVFGDGTMELSFIHAADLAAALRIAATHPGAAGATFYASHPEVVTTDALLDLIGRQYGRALRRIRIPRWVAGAALTATGAWSRLTGRRTILYPDKIHELFQDAWTADPARFTAATDWRPEWNLERGLAHTAQWYRENGWL